MAAAGQRDDVVVETARSLRAWTDVIHHRFVSLRIAQNDASELSGSVRSRQIGHLQASVVRSTPQTFTRTRRLATVDDHNLLAVGAVERGTGCLEQDGRACVVADGDFALYDTSRPFGWSLTGDWTLRVYTWPLDAVTVTEAESRTLTATTVRGDAGIGCFLSPMLASLASTSTTVSPLTSARLASEVAELAITAAWEAGHRDACDQPDREQLQRIQIFIEQNLADPELTPPRIAHEFFMSARTLHRLFARHGLTVAAWIKRRRLEACRRALGSPTAQHLGINEIACRYGFPNPSFFSREFTLQYGESPRTYRSRLRG
jgi:AraC-like DNA-binding protein